MRKLLVTFALAAASAITVVACGGDDSTPGATPDGGGGTDAGNGSDTSVVGADAGNGSDTGGNTNDSGTNGDAADGGCDFAAFVINLVNHTADNTQPSTDLGEACTDKQDQTQFSSLFP